MTSPHPDDVRGSFGYHPSPTDVTAILAAQSFSRLLVLGPTASDLEHSNLRTGTQVPAGLAAGVYWFSGSVDDGVMVVMGADTQSPASVVASEALGTALGNAHAWFEHLWTEARELPAANFQVNDDVVVKASGDDGVVRERRFVDGRWHYSVFAAGKRQWMVDDALNTRPTADDPAAWVRSNPARPSRFAATLTRAKLAGQFSDMVFSFRATRTLFRPYQFKPVMKLLQTGSFKLLIADEVGLGKTIEAGLLWTELEARRRADRVLVVCPSALVGKWRREMDERFGFDLQELTTPLMADLVERLQGDKLPRRMAYVCSIERLRAWSELETVTDLGLAFDVVVVDEAHAFRNTDTKSHALGQFLSYWAEALIMLSATPVNLRNDDLYNLLELLVPGEFGDKAALEARLEPNAVLHQIVESLLAPAVTNADRRRWLATLPATPYGAVLTRRPDFGLLRQELQVDQLDAAAVVRIKRLCAELHGLSGEVTRTRKVDVQEDKAIRVPQKVEIEWSAAERDFYDAFYQWCVERAAVNGMPLHFAMQMPLRLAGSCLPEAARSVLSHGSFSIASEENGADVPAVSGSDVAPSSRLVGLASSLDEDTKVVKFLAAVRDLVAQGRRVLVFTFSRRTLAYLQRNLQGVVRVSALHGGVDRQSRDRIMSEFRDGNHDVVVATRVASEGLDFEFCSAVVNYDLPWNPMEVEQRIGRIDRIGQTEEKLAVVNFHTAGTIETDIIARVMERIGVFEHAIGALEPILESQWADIQSTLFDFNLSPEQRTFQAEQTLVALEEQAQALGDVAQAAATLISSDGVDIDGLEDELTSTGRYVGQHELALLLEDWAETYGGSVEPGDEVLGLTGNAQMAGHLRDLVSAGERGLAEVNDLVSQLQAETPIHLSLNQEKSRRSGVALLTANHPLTRAALRTPGYRHSRFTLLRMTTAAARTPQGSYLVLLGAMEWRGIRSSHEVWSSCVNLDTARLTATGLGDVVLAQLAEARLQASVLRTYALMDLAVQVATNDLLERAGRREAELVAENDAFRQARNLSVHDVHQRRMASIRSRIVTLRERGRGESVIRMQQAQLRKEETRHAAVISELERMATATVGTESLAICVVEVQG